MNEEDNEDINKEKGSSSLLAPFKKKNDSKNQKQIGKVLKKVIKNAIKSVVTKISLPIIIGGTGILAVILFFYSIGDKIEEAVDSVSDNISLIFSVNDESKNIEIDEEVLKEEYKRFENMGININKLGFGDDTEEYFRKLLEAEIVTSYPYMGGDGLQGIVYFERLQIDGSKVQMEYISSSQFDEKLENNSNDFNKYFSLEEYEETTNAASGSANTGDDSTSDESTTTKKMRVKYAKLTPDGEYEKDYIDYRAECSDKYSMPLGFTVPLSYIVQNPKFITAVVDLVKNSKIVITIAEEQTITTVEKSREYNEMVITETKDKNGSVKRDVSGPIPVKRQVDTTTTITYTSRYLTTLIDTWITTKSIPLSYDSTTTNTEESQSVPDEENTVSISNGTVTTKKTGIKEITNTTINVKSWTTGNAEVTAELDKFLSLFVTPVAENGSTSSTTSPYVKGDKVYYKLPNGTKQAPYYKFINGRGMFLQFLSKTEKTQNHEILMKYAIYMLTGNDYYGVNSFTFDDQSNMNSVTTGGSVGLEFLKSWEGEALWKYINGKTSYESYVSNFITADKTKYKCYSDSSSRPTSGPANWNFGFGVCHELNPGEWNTGDSYQGDPGVVGHYTELGINIKEYETKGMELEVTIVDQVMEKEYGVMRDRIVKEFQASGITLEQYQLDALTATDYLFGWSISSKKRANMVSAYIKYYLNNDHEGFRNNCGGTYFTTGATRK